MNILTHPVHTGYQYDLAQTGHEFYSLDTPGTGEIFWDTQSRPLPKNYHRLKRLLDADVKFDLILAHYNVGFHSLKPLDLPLIYKEHCIRKEFEVPAEWLERISYFCFASPTAAARWMVPAQFARRKIIIGMGMDLHTYDGYHGSTARILAVGQNICSRGHEKGSDNLLLFCEELPITVVGNGNQRFPGAVGPAENYDQLIEYYRSHRVFLNPSDLLGMSTLEAMATGMPVVSFRMINSDVIVSGTNGFLVETTGEARKRLKQLLNDEQLARELGRNARATIAKRFPRELFIKRWNELFRKAVEEYRPGLPSKMWQRFDLTAKPPRERKVAQKMARTAFEYRRVGYDRRKMTFLLDGRVGEGAGGCEVFWDVTANNGSFVLELSSGEQLTCRLKLQPGGGWRGRWLHHEKMPIELAPLRRRRTTSRRDVVALIAIRNEERYLEGYFRHLRDFVDGFIVFDDNSTDRSLAIVKAERKVLALIERKKASAPHFFEVQNRKALLNKAWELRARWVLCCDADERFEKRFLEQLRSLLRSKPERCVMALRLRALWNAANQFRVDGIYSNRHKYVLFPCEPVEDYYRPGVLHSPWYPPNLAWPEKQQIFPFNLYHLKSIDAKDRMERYEKFKAVDADLRRQPEGYEHLISERNALFEQIPKGREYVL
jgi:hypothetical protein